MGRVRRALAILEEAGREFVADDVVTLSSSVAFYAALGLAPMAVLVLVGTSFLGSETRDRLVGEGTNLLGPQAGDALRMALESSAENRSRGLAAVFGVLAALVSASGALAQLQVAMNRVWGVVTRADAGWKEWLRKRALGLGAVLCLGALVVASLVVEAALGILPLPSVAWPVVQQLVSLAVFTTYFAWMFWWFPDAKIRWRDAFLGAAFTAPLFVVGKFAIGLYFARSAAVSAFGAAGSFVALLLWIYYSSIILFFGAELTQVLARAFGAEIVPDEHGAWADARAG